MKIQHSIVIKSKSDQMNNIYDDATIENWRTLNV